MEDKIRKLIDEEIEHLQGYIDKGFFQYDSYKDIELNLVNIDTQEFLDRVRKWDFSEMDNAIWHYARITLLEELFLAQINNTLEEE